MKIKKEHICTALQIAYHLTFIGGATTLGNHYLDEFKKTRDTVVKQVDRAENIANKIEKEINKVKKACRF